MPFADGATSLPHATKNVNDSALPATSARIPRRASRSRLDSGEERIFVQFPAEWLRNPQSPWLRRHPVDVPWDDPELLDAMLALRNER